MPILICPSLVDLAGSTVFDILLDGIMHTSPVHRSFQGLFKPCMSRVLQIVMVPCYSAMLEIFLR